MGGSLFPTGPEDIAKLKEFHGLPVTLSETVGTVPLESLLVIHCCIEEAFSYPTKSVAASS